MRNRLFVLLLCLALLLSFVGCTYAEQAPVNTQKYTPVEQTYDTPQESVDPNVITLENLPAFSGEPFIVLHDNIPQFSDKDLNTDAYEYFSELDDLGRCGVVMACIGQELMPTEERGSIGQVKPTGWQTVKYDFVDGKYLYNRCHLIGFQLTGENANEQNLITGTRYMNVDGMLPFENMVADYIKETNNHVLYRVTPVYNGSDLVAQGVVMEAKSVEDHGEGIEFHVFCYNVQPGVEIDYATGSSCLAETAVTQDKTVSYILNTNSKKFHTPDCHGVQDMKAENRKEYSGTRHSLIDQGYSPCGQCNP